MQVMARHFTHKEQLQQLPLPAELACGAMLDSSRAFPCLIHNLVHTDFCDVTVTTSAGDWRLHSLLLASRSEFFYRALAGEFTESRSKVIELHLEKSEAVSTATYVLLPSCVGCWVCGALSACSGPHLATKLWT
jgi:hypothetical protein